MKIELMRLGVSPSAAATFVSAAGVRPFGAVEGSPAWSPPE